LVSYAASTGETADFGAAAPRVTELLHRYAAVGVREVAGQSILAALGLAATVTLDPAPG